MALQTIPGRVWLPERINTNDVSFTLDLTMDAVNEIAGCVFKAPKTGNITHVIYSLTGVSVTSGPLNFDARIESVNTSTGINSGSLLNSGTTNDSNGTDSIATTDDNDQREIALTTSGGVAVTVGDPIAFVLTAPSSGTFDVRMASWGGDSAEDDPYCLSGTTATPTKVNRAPVFGLKYSDGSYWAPVGCYPVETMASPVVNTGTNPDEVGNSFTFPFPVRINAVAIYMDPAASTSFTLEVWDSGLSSLYDKVIDCDINFAQDDGTIVIPISDLDFDANEEFYVTCTPDGATSMEFHYFTVETAAYLDMFSCGQNVHGVTRDGGTGAFTAETTRRYMMSVGVCAFDDGAGSGGSGIAVLTAGGLVR